MHIIKYIINNFDFRSRPSEDAIVWRGVREDLSADYPKGREFAWWAFSSCTASMSVLESPNYLGKSGARTIFSIQTTGGKYIRAHSYFENEDEILLPPGIYLKVIDVLSPADGLHIIQLREIPAPFKTISEPFDLSQMKKKLPEITPPPLPSPIPIKVSPQPKPPIKQESSSSTSTTPKAAVQVAAKNGK